ncbi:MAG: Asp-tRNA(Asn)/Glu-tRNA(Gln) amidotransferase subunit GatB [Chloroflexi bacterium]|nr:Asp-tRNA(Asn)/Glu-tRNA(Gln) amidotransferase subunit GatB [Chloroflexota bacterium]MBI4215963.1 Asp-tRNA(Asn)/Glu-tRNA(Gln) amidotransferase subunit GatB [Chloroflexota bacterium]
MEYETVIGLEVHAQLLTRSKMFCRCSADYAAAPPNTHVCPVCLGLPGVLPVINEQAIRYTVMTALALNCAIAGVTKFDRKNYPYPDLVKGYQISQYDTPISHQGWLAVEADGATRRIGITRVHLEEDTAKLLHRNEPGGETYSLVDVNRSGVPLMEIVSEPDLRSPEEARRYLMKLRTILQYLGVSTGNMEEGSFRCDANVSLRPLGTSEYLSKVEVKNMNSFRAVFRALQYEVERQQQVLGRGERIVQETRGWVEDRGVTVSQRSKEEAHDYRYFPEPDLPPLALSPAWVEEIRASLPELPEARGERFISHYGLSPYDAGLLTAGKALADYFESCLTLAGAKDKPETLPKKAKEVSNWLLGEFLRLLNAGELEVEQARVSPAGLVRLMGLVEEGAITLANAKQAFEEMFRTGQAPEQVVAEKGLAQISDQEALATLVEQAIAANPRPVADYRAGKEQALSFLMGQVMRASGGRADPQAVRERLRERLRPT